MYRLMLTENLTVNYTEKHLWDSYSKLIKISVTTKKEIHPEYSY